jgi:hypothetical protein
LSDSLFKEIVMTVRMDGLPPGRPWSALLEVGPHRLGVRVAGGDRTAR